MRGAKTRIERAGPGKIGPGGIDNGPLFGYDPAF